MTLESSNLPASTSSSSSDVAQPAASAAGAAAALALPEWQLDPAHSSVGFRVRHLMVSHVRGEFQQVSARLRFDPKRLPESQLSAAIEVASIHTGQVQRDAHLASADFFDAAQHPQITFESHGFAPVQGGYDVTGALTLRGVTRELTLALRELSEERRDPWGQLRFGATVSAQISRTDFGMTWNSALEAGGVMVGDQVSIQIEVSLTRAA